MQERERERERERFNPRSVCFLGESKCIKYYTVVYFDLYDIENKFKFAIS